LAACTDDKINANNEAKALAFALMHSLYRCEASRFCGLH